MRDIAGGSQIALAKELKRSAAQLDGTVPNTGFLQAWAGLLC